MLLPSLKALGALGLLGYVFSGILVLTSVCMHPGALAQLGPPGGTVVIHQRLRRPGWPGRPGISLQPPALSLRLRYYFLIYSAISRDSLAAAASEKALPSKGSDPARRKVV